MSATRATPRKDTRDTPAPDVVSPPPVVGGGNDFPAFVWQQLGSMQQTLGKLQQAIDQQVASTEKLSEKIDETKEKIHSINIKLAVAGAVVTVALAVVAWVGAEVWSVVKPTLVHRLTAEPPAAPTPSK